MKSSGQHSAVSIQRSACSSQFSVFSSQFAVLLVLLATGCAALPGPVSARRTTINLPTYTWGPHDINPKFDPESRRVSIYPYPMQDNLGREKTDRDYEALVIENEYLRVTVLPELGGHVHSVFDKAVGREMFYVNQVVKPGLIGMAGAWISGGIEWNTGPQVHTVTAVHPVACRLVEHDDGSRSIAIGHVERVYRTQWMVQVRLRPGRRFLEERIRIYNRRSTPAWYYFWNCTAVPNTDGTEFVYPMKLGTDHGYGTFYSWPFHEGKDLRWSKGYDEPTGHFAYQCDQDFFGSYDHDIDYGLVAFADHHQLPGKKAWTWGRGQDGIVSMDTLTDDGSWYNEIQTGPLQTQADVAPLGPHQAIEWTEWWYPVHGLGGYEHATKDVAINVLPRVAYGGESTEPVGQIRIGATGTFSGAQLVISKDHGEVMRVRVNLSPREPAIVALPAGVAAPIRIEIRHDGAVLSSFVHPLPLADREPPTKTSLDEGATAAWRRGLREESSGNLKAARKAYEEALEKQADFLPAMKSLAAMDLRSGLWAGAAERLDGAMESDPGDGMAHYLRAEAALGMKDDERALAEAWKAARIAETDAIGLNLVGQVCIRMGRWADAESALRQALRRDGEDLSSWNLLAIVLESTGRREPSVQACLKVLDVDPVDSHAAAMLLLIETTGGERLVSAGLADELRSRFWKDPQELLEPIARLHRLGLYQMASSTLCAGAGRPTGIQNLMIRYYAAGLHQKARPAVEPVGPDVRAQAVQINLSEASRLSLDFQFPHRVEEIELFRAILAEHPEEARVWYLLGNVLFSRHRFEEAREAWDRAAELGLPYSVLHRNIGLARDTLDKDTAGAITAYEQAHALNPHDLVLMRDLGRLYARQEQWDEVVALLEKSLDESTHRSDVTEDLVRAYERLDRLDQAAALLDARTFNQWEGQQSLHRLFELVHRRLGEKAMQRGDYPTAIREFGRALEFPRNLGVGKTTSRSQAQVFYLLGKAHAAAGQPAQAREAWQKAAAEGEKGGEPAKEAAAALASMPAGD